MTVRAEVSKIGERKWRGVITCEEVPQMNDTHIYQEDKGTPLKRTSRRPRPYVEGSVLSPRRQLWRLQELYRVTHHG